MPAVIWLVPRMKYRLAVSGLLFHSYLDLLLRVFLPRTPSSSSASTSPHSPPPTGFLRGAPASENFFRARHCQTFDCVGISALASPRFLFFLFKFVLFSCGSSFSPTPPRIFHTSLLNSAVSLSLSLLLCDFYLADNRFFSRVLFSIF